LLSDQGTHFTREILQVLTKSLDISQIFVSPYHPQTNGLTECLNQAIKQMIVPFVNPLHLEWDIVLPFVVHAYNTSTQVIPKLALSQLYTALIQDLPPDIHTKKLQNGG
jgi:transposase InsO family protein